MSVVLVLRGSEMRVAGRRPTDSFTISVIVPARNEARNLEVVLPGLPAGVEVIVVDGHSVDDSEQVVASVRPDARFIQQTRQGRGNALAVGFASATGDIIVIFDADGSADPSGIDRFVQTLLAGADYAKGSRVLPGGGSLNNTRLDRVANRALTSLANAGFRASCTDLGYGYSAFWADILPQLDLPDIYPVSGPMVWGDGFEIDTLINCRVAAAGLDVTEVPCVQLQRPFRAGNQHVLEGGFRVLKTVATEWRRNRRAQLWASGSGRGSAPAEIRRQLPPANDPRVDLSETHHAPDDTRSAMKSG